MTVLVLLVVGVLVVFWRRSRRRAQLAGLDANRPTYAVQPPGGRVGSRKREAL